MRLVRAHLPQASGENLSEMLARECPLDRRRRNGHQVQVYGVQQVGAEGVTRVQTSVRFLFALLFAPLPRWAYTLLAVFLFFLLVPDIVHEHWWSAAFEALFLASAVRNAGLR